MIVVDSSALLDVTGLKLLKSLQPVVIPDRVIEEVERQRFRSDKADKANRALKALERLDFEVKQIDTDKTVDQAILKFAKGHTLFTLDTEMVFLHKGEIISWPDLTGIFPINEGDTIDVNQCKQERPNQLICVTRYGYRVLVNHANKEKKSKFEVVVEKVILKKTGAIIIAKLA